ncbi:type II toxin-antitoxin system VapC family toxin [Halalkalibacter krulwichiae]|nr:PIN domain-containing protein [Halalkalibacter krulwichiae]
MSNEKKSVVFSINDANWGNTTIPYPETIYLDANPIIDIALDRENSDLVKSFLTSVTQQDGVIFWSSHTKQEVTRVLHASEYSKYADLNGITKRGNTPSWKMAENKMTSYQSSQLNKSVLQKRDELFSLLENLGLEVTANDYNDTVVHRSAETLYSTYGGSIEDAKHVAIANSIGVNDILSHDKGFLNYPNLNIYGNSYAITRKFLMNAKPNDFIDINSFTLIKKEAK